jgi:Flp pilus assembly protein TadG
MSRTHQHHKRRGVAAVETAVVLPVLIILMFGLWEVGRLIQVTQVVNNAAREGGRYAAGGYVNGTPITTTMVQQAVRDYLSGSGFPAAAYNGAQVQLTCNASPAWTNPSDALPLDPFEVKVTIPPGAAFDSLAWSVVTRITGVNQIVTTASWRSLVDEKISVDANLPY